MAISTIFSDHFFEHSSLEMLSDFMRSNRGSMDPSLPEFDANGAAFIRSFHDDPSPRDIITLVRKARDGWFQKEINFHYIGPDGYRALVMVRGRDLEKKLFDLLRRENNLDVFFLEVYEGESAITNQIKKNHWYCVKDIFRCMDMAVQDRSIYERYLYGMSKVYAEDYLGKLAGT